MRVMRKTRKMGVNLEQVFCQDFHAAEMSKRTRGFPICSTFVFE